jgi:hypothetical protein
MRGSTFLDAFGVSDALAASGRIRGDGDRIVPTYTRDVNDTPPEIERKQIALLRAAGPDRRSMLASELTEGALERARRGIADAHPDWTDLERRLLFVQVHYGDDLARRVRADIARRRRE